MGFYYSEDAKAGNDYRLEYFDSQFESLAGQLAKEQGITLSQFLSDVRNISSFKAKLREVFSGDTSLANYVDGMKSEDFQLFFNRPLIQDIVEANLSGQKELIEEEIITKFPTEVVQEEKEVSRYFKAVYTEYSTGKIKRTVAKETSVKIRGKEISRLRDSKGRFVKRN